MTGLWPTSHDFVFKLAFNSENFNSFRFRIYYKQKHLTIKWTGKVNVYPLPLPGGLDPRIADFKRALRMVRLAGLAISYRLVHIVIPTWSPHAHVQSQ